MNNTKTFPSQNGGNIPPQKVSESQRTSSWFRSTIDGYDGLTHSNFGDKRSSRDNKRINYELFNGRLNRNDFLQVVDPFGFGKSDFPANLQHYDIISPKLKLLIGEEMKRPLNYQVLDFSPEAFTRREVQIKQLLVERLASFLGNPEPDEQGNVNYPEEVQKYMNTTWQDDEAIKGFKILKYLENNLTLKLKFNEGFKDALISGEEIYQVGDRGGEPYVRLCNPMQVSVVSDPDNINIEDSEAVVEERWLTISSVLDEFHEDLTSAQIKKLEDYMNRSSGEMSKAPAVNQDFAEFSILPTSAITEYSDQVSSQFDNQGNVRVVRVEWKSFKKVGFLEYIDDMGFTVIDLLSEDFEIPEGSFTLDKKDNYQFGWYDEELDRTYKFKWSWINEVLEGVKIGDDIQVQTRAKKVQRRAMDNPSVCKLGYIGKIYDARNSQSMSLIDRMKSYQYLQNIIYYRTELAFAKAKGKLGIMDLAQLPTSHEIDLEKFLQYAETMGWVFINSADNDVPEGSKSFNQWSEIDLSLGNYIQQHVMFLSKIEEQIGELAGVPRQRLGQVETSELVGNTERVVTQSSHVTEYWFANHEDVKKKVLEALLDVAKVSWEKGRKLQYITDDYTAASLVINDAFSSAQYGVMVSNSSKDATILQSLRGLSEAALRSGTASLGDMVKVYRMESIPQLERELMALADKKQQEALQMQEQQQASAREASMLRMEEIERESIEKQKDRDHELEAIALKAELENFNSSNDKDEISRRDMDLKERKFKEETELKKKELQEKERTNRKNEELKNKSINKSNSRPKK